MFIRDTLLLRKHFSIIDNTKWKKQLGQCNEYRRKHNIREIESVADIIDEMVSGNMASYGDNKALHGTDIVEVRKWLSEKHLLRYFNDRITSKSPTACITDVLPYSGGKISIECMVNLAREGKIHELRMAGPAKTKAIVEALKDHSFLEKDFEYRKKVRS